MKRLVCILAALQVCVMSSFAWSAESFVGNDYDHYNQMEAAQSSDFTFEDSGVAPDQSGAFTIEPRAGMDDDGVGTLYDLDLTAPTSIQAIPIDTVGGDWLWQIIGNSSVYIPGYPDGTTITSPGSQGELNVNAVSPIFSDNGNTTFDFYGFPNQTVSFDADRLDNWVEWRSCGVLVTFDIPVPADTYGISFVPNLSIFGRSSFRASATERYAAYGKLYVNGNEYLSFSNNGFSNPAFIEESSITFTEPIESAQLILYTQVKSFTNGLPTDTTLSGTGVWWHRLFIRDESYAKFGFLSKDPALGLENEMTKNDLNKHDQLESEWTSSMTENFDSLDIQNFEYPTELVSAFALISGIFNDLWNGMGDFRILYVMPLTLGIVLVIIGKMARTDGMSKPNTSRKGEESVQLVVRDR